MKPGNLLTAGEHTMKILKQMTECLAVLLVTLIAPADAQAQDRLDHPPGAAWTFRRLVWAIATSCERPSSCRWDYSSTDLHPKPDKFARSPRMWM